MTVQIALCDDETAELKKIDSLLSGYEQKCPNSDFVIQCFENADELLAMVKESSYSPDLVFLDIYMPGKQGTEAARELRGMGKRCSICFLTSSKEHALEAFRVNAVQYLVKPVSDRDLFPVLDRFIEDMGRQKKYLLLGDCGIKRWNYITLYIVRHRKNVSASIWRMAPNCFRT